MIAVSDYRLFTDEVCGDGMQAKVIKAVNILTGKSYVAKVTRLCTARQIELFENELEILKRLCDCDYAVRVVESFYLKDMGILILEEMPFDLMTLIEKGALKLEEYLEIFKQVCLAVKELHSRNVVHLDIKPENILVSADYKTVRICDFGCSKITNHRGFVSSSVGTLMYCSPEGLSCTSHFDGKKADIWSLGILYHVLITQRWPFATTTDEQVKCLIMNAELTYHRGLAEHQIKLLNKMTHLDPTKRCDITYLCSSQKRRLSWRNLLRILR